MFSTTLEPYDTDKMANEFLQQFSNQSFSVGQQFVFQLQDQKKTLMLSIKEIEGKNKILLKTKGVPITFLKKYIYKNYFFSSCRSTSNF